MSVAMATIGKTLFAHFRQVLHASAQYDQARTVFHRLKKRLEVSNLCSLSWDQTVIFSDLAHGLFGVATVVHGGVQAVSTCTHSTGFYFRVWSYLCQALAWLTVLVHMELAGLIHEAFL